MWSLALFTFDKLIPDFREATCCFKDSWIKTGENPDTKRDIHTWIILCCKPANGTHRRSKYRKRWLESKLLNSLRTTLPCLWKQPKFSIQTRDCAQITEWHWGLLSPWWTVSCSGKGTVLCQKTAVKHVLSWWVTWVTLNTQQCHKISVFKAFASEDHGMGWGGRRLPFIMKPFVLAGSLFLFPTWAWVTLRKSLDKSPHFSVYLSNEKRVLPYLPKKQKTCIGKCLENAKDIFDRTNSV